MTISELIKALNDLKEKHGDLPIYFCDKEPERVAVEKVQRVLTKWPSAQTLISVDKNGFTAIPHNEYILLKASEIPPTDNEIDGQLDIAAFAPEGTQIKTPKGHIVTIPNDSPSGVFSIQDDDEGATVTAH